MRATAAPFERRTSRASSFNLCALEPRRVALFHQADKLFAPLFRVPLLRREVRQLVKHQRRLVDTMRSTDADPALPAPVRVRVCLTPKARAVATSYAAAHKDTGNLARTDGLRILAGVEYHYRQSV